ncbi:hypothetical protein EPUS_03773 [Endocarpon pusillum Z07020]|uniref:MYND-type domain-containing protein n=1 Tax=Endocarpon pusillum (strain Z07020 / HMAS-L-300199) TaxID=1263415 RepID=U1HEG7_ENDPU|nr:uncharacterized protein EPUS_03773 [Endocarpon pusillum Z07020]ERF68455.1 hypothetical protein EPUS_03773 [Endocarpon pusillum Z07020]
MATSNEKSQQSSLTSKIPLQIFCANTDLGDHEPPCRKPGSKACSGCFLVQYCSKECQKIHWPAHKLDCKSPLIKETWKPSWHMERREPAFMRVSFVHNSFGMPKYLWGNVPAIDLLNLKDNEADATEENFRLLFAGDLRNFIKSVLGLPQKYTGMLETVVNDRDFDLVSRNVILLLTALHFDPDTAAIIMLHLWYSALLPGRILHQLRESVLPLIQEVCMKIQAKPSGGMLSKKWTLGARSLRLVLPKEDWNLLLSYFEVPKSLSATQAQKVRRDTTMACQRKDYLDRALYKIPPGWRAGTMKFRDDGILLPFSASRREFDTPNPTFYQNDSRWPLADSAGPLEGWSIDEVLQKLPDAKNDIYGALFFYLKDLLTRFCKKIAKISISVQLLHVDAVDLPDTLRQCGVGEDSFDRIELSNICDEVYIGPVRCLFVLGPLLRTPASNPHATLLMLFLNAIEETFIKEEKRGNVDFDFDPMRPYFPRLDEILSRSVYDPDNLNVWAATAKFRDFDGLWERFTKDCRLHEVGNATGMVMKENTIVPKWPLRLKQHATQAEFSRLQASGRTGCERYAEWRRAA